jgi:hypothetical protein
VSASAKLWNQPKAASEVTPSPIAERKTPEIDDEAFEPSSVEPEGRGNADMALFPLVVQPHVETMKFGRKEYLLDIVPLLRGIVVGAEGERREPKAFR